MRGLIFSWTIGAFIFFACCTGVGAQGNPPMPAQSPDMQKAVETKRIERDGSAQIVHYTLAGIGTIIVMAILCMPARRE